MNVEVLSDFAADNVMYLELRTTPRAVPRTKMTKMSYVQTIVDEVKKWHTLQETVPVHQRMMVRLLLSVDRRGSVDEARNTIEIAHHFQSVDHGALMVGVDFSGNPAVGSFRVRTLSLPLPLLV
jgi:adenosine deaminase